MVSASVVPPNVGWDTSEAVDVRMEVVEVRMEVADVRIDSEPCESTGARNERGGLWPSDDSGGLFIRIGSSWGGGGIVGTSPCGGEPPSAGSSRTFCPTSDMTGMFDPAAS